MRYSDFIKVINTCQLICRYDSSEKLVDSFTLPGTVEEEIIKPKRISGVTSGRLTVKSLHNVWSKYMISRLFHSIQNCWRSEIQN